MENPGTIGKRNSGTVGTVPKYGGEHRDAYYSLVLPN